MAERRMFAKTIIDSDAFLDMPMSAQALYFHLCMRADDEGFVNNPKKIQRMVGASDDDAKLLIGKKFIIPFDSGVVVIKHWRIHNYIRQDRLKPTAYEDEKSQLSLKSNGAYTLCQSNVSQMSVTCPSNVSIGKDRIGKDRIGESIDGAPTLQDIQDYCRERDNGVDADRFFNYYAARGWKTKGEAIHDWKALLRTWEDKKVDRSATLKRLEDLKAKRDELKKIGDPQRELEVIELNIQSIEDSMEVQ